MKTSASLGEQKSLLGCNRCIAKAHRHSLAYAMMKINMLKINQTKPLRNRLHMEEWPSGLRYLSRKQARVYTLREFESHLFRQSC